MTRLPLAFLLSIGLAAPLAAQADSDVHILPVQGNVYMLVTPTANVAVQVGEDGVLLVDTSSGGATSDKIMAAVKTLSQRPLRIIINTSADPDHVGGNEAIARQGSAIAGGNMGNAASARAMVIGHENVLNRMSAPTGKEAPTPEDAWPTDTFFTARKEVSFNNEPIEILYQPKAHTDGDSIVFFRRSDVVVTGDVFDTTSYPLIDTAKGGTIDGVVNALNHLLDITIPKDKQEGGTYVIPGHGRLCDEADLLEYRDMMTIIRDRIRDLVTKGRTLDQVKAARPTLDYDPRFGSTTGTWTTDKFVEAAYRSMGGK